MEALVTENGLVAQRFFARNTAPNHEYDVIIVGSGMGGGLLASRLADKGADVLVLEAGSFLFPTHVGNLPRRLKIGQFDKNIWSLWPDFKITNYQNTPGSGFAGADLRFLDYDNLYTRDNSVFPTSPAANPSLTLAALALRLAEHLA